MLSLLVFIGEAVRDAFDPRKSSDEPGMALLEVRDLSVTFAVRRAAGPGRARRLVRVERARPWRWSAIRLRQVGDRALDPAAAALSRGRHPTGSIRFDGQELVGARRPRPAKIRGNRIAMIFQEPMTSLNPLHTIEQQINEVLFVHHGLAGPRRRARTLELLHLVRHPGAGDAAWRRIRTSSPAASASGS